MQKRKKIIVFGEDNAASVLFYDSIKKFLMIDDGKSNISRGNYLEISFSIGESEYVLISTSSSLFPNKNDNEIEKEIKQLNQELLLSSDIVYIVINAERKDFDYNLTLQKYLSQNGKEYLVVFSSAHSDNVETKDSFLTNSSVHRIMNNSERTYFFSALRNDRSLLQIKQFVRDEFAFDPECDKITRLFETATTPKLTIFGPPNSGKSTLLNSLLDKKRSIVSSIAGTTRENVVSPFNWQGISFELKDTEGIVINKRNDRTILSDCQMSWVVLDSTMPVTKKTLQIISLAEKCNRAITIILNKSDIADEHQMHERREEINSRLKSFSFVPVVSISAYMKSNFPELLTTLERSVEQSQLRFSKALIAQQFSKLLEKNPPSAICGKRLKIYYALHESGFVHKFVIFVNNPELVHFSYHRYIVNSLRKNLQIDSLPIRLFFKKS